MDRSEEATFRRLTIADHGLITSLPGADAPAGIHRLDARTEALLKLGALIALDAPPSSYREAVDAAFLAGARVADLLAVVFAVAETVGSARVVSAAPRIALAAGYDVDAALEQV